MSFPYEQFPPHVKDLSLYAWKALAIDWMIKIHQQHHPFSSSPSAASRGFIYIDTGTEVWAPFMEDIVHQVEQTGGYFLTRQGTTTRVINERSLLALRERFPPIFANLPPLNVSYPGINDSTMVEYTRGSVIAEMEEKGYDIFDKAHVWSGLIAVKTTSCTPLANLTQKRSCSSFYTDIVEPWVWCSLRKKCIAPADSSLSTHKFDQSILSVLVRSRNYVVNEHLKYWHDWKSIKERARSEVVFFSRRHHCPKPYQLHLRFNCMKYFYWDLLC